MWISLGFEINQDENFSKNKLKFNAINSEILFSIFFFSNSFLCFIENK